MKLKNQQHVTRVWPPMAPHKQIELKYQQHVIPAIAQRLCKDTTLFVCATNSQDPAFASGCARIIDVQIDEDHATTTVIAEGGNVSGGASTAYLDYPIWAVFEIVGNNNDARVSHLVGEDMTVEEVAKTYNIQPGTVRRTIHMGWLKARKSGKSWLIRRFEAEQRWGKK